MEIVRVKDIDGEFIGYMETNLSPKNIQEMVEESTYNYDINEIIDDIKKRGFKADRIYLAEVTIV
jgi:hypothetical protein